MIKYYTIILILFFSTLLAAQDSKDPKATEVWEPEPQEVLFGKNNIPSDAIVLFNGTDAKAWTHDDDSEVKWNIFGGIMTVVPGTGQIKTREHFNDCQLHIEWRSPNEPDRVGQDKGNSGVFFQGRYEVQILNSFRNRTYSNGQAASVYKQHIPLVNATKPSGEWNTYDIIFHAPQFAADSQKMVSGRFTVLHNGIVVQDNVEIVGTTEYIGPPKNTPHGAGPIILQDHSNEVSFRNIWIRTL